MRKILTSQVDELGRIRLPEELLHYLKSSNTRKIDFYISGNSLILLPEGSPAYPHSGFATLTESPVDPETFYADMPDE